jgi:hypothetical protein
MKLVSPIVSPVILRMTDPLCFFIFLTALTKKLFNIAGSIRFLMVISEKRREKIKNVTSGISNIKKDLTQQSQIRLIKQLIFNN